MRYLRKFEGFYDNKSELEDICKQFLINLKDNNYNLSFKDPGLNYFNLIIDNYDDKYIDWNFIKDDILNLIEYLLKATELKFDNMEFRSCGDFMSYLYSNKLYRLISGEDIKNVIYVKKGILEISIVFRIGI